MGTLKIPDKSLAHNHYVIKTMPKLTYCKTYSFQTTHTYTSRRAVSLLQYIIAKLKRLEIQLLHTTSTERTLEAPAAAAQLPAKGNILVLLPPRFSGSLMLGLAYERRHAAPRAG